MIRNLGALTKREFDVVVIGGGIYGICTAWDAVRRGLTVALVERGDFAHATSANSFKIVHGGVRYLQHADFPRLRESSQERTTLLRIAPHLVQLLPIVVPTYGRGMRGRLALRAGLALYDCLTWDRNRDLVDPDRRIPRSRMISREECLSLFPDLPSDGLTGGAIFHDGQIYNPPRLALSILRSAVNEGAAAANYVEAMDFLRRGSRIRGVRARDVLGGGSLEIRAKVVINATGPWAEGLVARSLGFTPSPPSTFSRDACFVVARRLLDRYAVAIPAQTRDPDAIVSRGKRHLFIVPWRDNTLIGVWHVVHRRSPDDFSVTDDELQRFLDEVNEAYPALCLTLDDVWVRNAGLVLFGNNEPGAPDLSYGKRSRIIDHARAHGVEGLITIIGVRWTTARRVADNAMGIVSSKLACPLPRCTTAHTPVYGGAIDGFEDFVSDAVQEHADGLTPRTVRHLAHNYGTEYRQVLAYAGAAPQWKCIVPGSPVLEAEVVHAVREEMAQRLSDVVFRRTDLGTAEYPGDTAIAVCAEIMARELDWHPDRTQTEMDDVRRAFPRLQTVQAA